MREVAKRAARPSAAPEAPRGPAGRRGGPGAPQPGGTCEAAPETAVPLPEHEVQAEMERCRETIESCAQAITPQSLRELRSLRRPPGAVAGILEATAVLLGAVEAQQARKALQGTLPERQRDVELDPREVRKALQGNLPEKIREINPEEVTLAQFRRLRRLLALPGFDEELVRGVCPSAVPLAVLCCALGACLAKTCAWGGSEDLAPASTCSSARPRCTGSELQDSTGDRSPPLTARGSLPGDGSSGAKAHASKNPGGLVISPDLFKLSVKELQQVSDLTVSRAEIGKIVFHGVTDCTDLDVPNLVHLDIGEVLVYPQGSKPPPGQGLNKAATVTLYQCWAPNGLKNLEDEASRERYRRKIQQMTEDKRARFIDYDCVSGVWKFQVEHF